MRRDGLQVTPENLTVLAPHRALLLPHGSSVCRHRAPCKPSSVIGTSVSLRRIDRACYQDRCDAHSDTSDDTHSPTRRDAKRSRREPQEGDHTASRSVDHVARSMPASAWRTPWTVAKPKTPAVAVRWRERRRSRPHPSFAPTTQPHAEQPNPTNPTTPPNPKSTILKLGPQSAGAEREMRQSSAVRGEEDAACLCRTLLLREVFFKNLQLSVRSLCCNCLRED